MSGVHIRPLRAEDAEALNEIRRQPGVMENILGIPSERIETSRAYLAEPSPDAHQFVAEIDGLVVGSAGLFVGRNRTRHTGHIGIMVRREYHGRGAGRALMHALLDVADNWLLLTRVDLEVFVSNSRAIALYESLGFETEGRKRNAAIRLGRYEDTLLMGRIRDTGQ